MPIGALFTAITALLLSLLIGRLLLNRVTSFPAMRRTSKNLVATRGDWPAVWLVAHTDTKSQTIGMLVRIGSLVVASIFFLLMVAGIIQLSLRLSVGSEFSYDTSSIQVAILSMMTVLSIVPFTLCFITNRSAGALDNASGVAAVLLAAELLPREKGVGVLLTSGEELALAGAKAFAATSGQKGIAVNCDTIDNAGRFICMTSGKGPESRKALMKGAATTGQKLRVRGTIPGILTDSVALAEAGWDTCTLSRGNLGTLALVHTSGDKPGRIDGTGIALAARILAATIEELS